jgi:hypothetical protein
MNELNHFCHHASSTRTSTLGDTPISASRIQHEDLHYSSGKRRHRRREGSCKRMRSSFLANPALEEGKTLMKAKQRQLEEKARPELNDSTNEEWGSIPP